MVRLIITKAYMALIISYTLCKAFTFTNLTLIIRLLILFYK